MIQIRIFQQARRGTKTLRVLPAQSYLIMASMNQIGHPNNDRRVQIHAGRCGRTNINHLHPMDAKKSFDAGKMVTSVIRDMIKSVLRGE